MYRKTPPQRSLFSVENQMDPVKRARLEKSWAHQFHKHALPLIDEDAFAKYFDPGNGRPNKSIRMVVGLLILKEIFNLTDDEVLEQLEWNLAWHHALDITPEEAHTCQKTLHNYRVMLANDDEGVSLFEKTTAKLIQSAGIRTQRQRQDSTHIMSNIRVLTRLGLFTETIRVFLEALRKAHPRLCSQVPEKVRERYLDREGYFGDARGSEAPRRLEQSALDVFHLVRQFGEHKTVSKMDGFALLNRLYDEQCVPPKGNSPKKIELQMPSSSSLQTPSDPDVTYGHKGKGYETQIAETCDEENDFQVVTSVDVHGANESDQKQVEPILEQTERTCGKAPEEMFADANYASGDNIVMAREEFGTDLIAPIGSKESDKYIPLAEFEFDADGEQVLRCPMGKVPIRQQMTRSKKNKEAVFAAKDCRGCRLRHVCPTEKRRDGRALKISKGTVAVARRREEQETDEFKEAYKIRSGIEATNSEAKRRHGLGKLRVREKPRVALSVRLKMLAMNVKRYVAHLAAMASTPDQAPAMSI